MKKIYPLFLAINFLACSCINGQLNYTFTSSTITYVPVIGGTTPALISSNQEWETSDEGFATIPIGFTFQYEGRGYTKVNVNVNGYITLGSPFEVNSDYKYFENSLRYSPGLPSSNNPRPVIAPFWDLYLVNDTNLVYQTTGTAPNRVFTIEWKRAKWTYDATEPVLSIELRIKSTSPRVM